MPWLNLCPGHTRHTANCQGLRATAARDGVGSSMAGPRAGQLSSDCSRLGGRDARNAVELYLTVRGGTYGFWRMVVNFLRAGRCLLTTIQRCTFRPWKASSRPTRQSELVRLATLRWKVDGMGAGIPQTWAEQAKVGREGWRRAKRILTDSPDRYVKTFREPFFFGCCRRLMSMSSAQFCRLMLRLIFRVNCSFFPAFWKRIPRTEATSPGCVWIPAHTLARGFLDESPLQLLRRLGQCCRWLCRGAWRIPKGSQWTCCWTCLSRRSWWRRSRRSIPRRTTARRSARFGSRRGKLP